MAGREMAVAEAIALAQRWAKAGMIPVLPVGIAWDPKKQATNKRPLLAHGFRDATTDLERVPRQFNGASLRRGEVLGVGLWPGPAHLMALDVDVKGGMRGDLALEELEEHHGALPEGPVTLTPTGGRHVWLDKGDRHVGNQDLAAGIEVRSDEGLVVAPGTITPWGEWKLDPSRPHLEEGAPRAPEWVTAGGGGSRSGEAFGHWDQVNLDDLSEPDREAVQLLMALGGHDPYRSHGYVHVCRPGKTGGGSASVGHIGPGITRVFTPSWPPLENGRVYDCDELAAILTKTQFGAGSPSAEPSAALAECLAAYRRWLHLPDDDVVTAVLGAVAANLLDGDPVWLLVVASGGSGKTEAIGPLAGLPYVYPVATLTEASLLSGTAGKDKERGATGGVLRQVGTFGILLHRDFSGVLSLHRDERGKVLSALREVFDGSWSRPVGTGGGRMLTWAGKCGLIGAVTPSIDRHTSVMGALGERFVFYRLDVDDPAAQGRRRLRNRGREETMRTELGKATTAVLSAVRPSGVPRDLTTAEEDALVNLACFVVGARSPVEREGYQHEVVVMPTREAPGRLVGSLGMLLAGLEAIGAEPATAWRITNKVGWDCVPDLRQRLLRAVRDNPGARRSDLVTATGIPANTAGRTLEDLSLLGLVSASKVGGHDTAAWCYSLSDEAVEAWPPASPESSGGRLLYPY